MLTIPHCAFPDIRRLRIDLSCIKLSLQTVQLSFWRRCTWLTSKCVSKEKADSLFIKKTVSSLEHWFKCWLVNLVIMAYFSSPLDEILLKREKKLSNPNCHHVADCNVPHWFWKVTKQKPEEWAGSSGGLNRQAAPSGNISTSMLSLMEKNKSCSSLSDH